MNILLDSLSVGLALIGCLFFISGTLGLFRLPDVLCRLHALTKADNAGLGLICLAVMLQATDFTNVLKIGFIWLLVLVTSSALGTLLAQRELHRPKH